MDTLIQPYEPSPLLGNSVQAYWTGQFNISKQQDFSMSVVPNGCIELIIHMTDEHCALNKSGNDWSKSPDFTLIGMYTQAYEVRFSRFVDVFAIRFYPDGVHNIFGIPPAHFLQTFEDSDDIFGKGFNEFCQQLRETQNPEERIALSNQYLLKQLNRNRQQFDYARVAAEIIRKEQGMLSQEQLHQQIHISPRQLQRAFKSQFGITMKNYMRLARLNAIQNYMQGKEQINLTDVSYDHGFTDQSHFIRDFKAQVGDTPSAFLKERKHYLVNVV